MKVSIAPILRAVLLLSLLLPSHSMEQYQSKRITEAEAVADVHQFFSTLQRVHPDLLARVDVGDYVRMRQRTLDGIAGKLDGAGTIDTNALAYSLSCAAAFFRDGHTLIKWWEIMPDQSGTRYPPFLLNYVVDRFVIAGSSDKGIGGFEVMTVNEKPIWEFLRPILDACSGETSAFRAGSFSYYQSFWYSFSDLCGSAKSLRIGLRDANGKWHRRNFGTVGFADFQKLGTDRPAGRMDEVRRQGTQLRFLDSGMIAYLAYPAFNYSEDEKRKMDGIFEKVKARKSRDLIIDLRGNGGGQSSMGDFIARYLLSGRFAQFSKVRVKASRDILASRAKDYGIPDDAGIDGSIVTMPIEAKWAPRPSAFFSGRTFLLVDNVTFSSAVSFAAMFRDYRIGEILGYETGGLPICAGDAYSFSLDHSGIPCSVSCAQVFPPKPRPGDDEHGIIPDVPMTSERLRPYMKERDPVLACTLDCVRRARKRHRPTR